jgi:hypothetical protein
MCHRIRAAMKREPMAGLLSGRVVADETWIGGEPKNRHGHKAGKGGKGVSRTRPAIGEERRVEIDQVDVIVRQ